MMKGMIIKVLNFFMLPLTLVEAVFVILACVDTDSVRRVVDLVAVHAVVVSRARLVVSTEGGGCRATVKQGISPFISIVPV